MLIGVLLTYYSDGSFGEDGVYLYGIMVVIMLSTILSILFTLAYHRHNSE